MTRSTGPGGEIRSLQWTDRALFDRNGGLRELQSVGRDITEQKHVEMEMARQQQMIRELSTPVLPVSPGLLIVPLIA